MQDLFDYFEQFQKLTEVEKNAISSTCKIIEVKKHEILEPIQSTSKNLYFLKSGVVRIFYYKDENEVTEYFALAGDLVTRIKSLLTQQPSSKAIQVLENGALVSINAHKFFQLFDTYPNIERLYRLLLESAYLALVERIESIQFYSAKERYATLLNDNQLIQKVPLKHIASYLGITQVSLSRIRATFQTNSDTK